MATLNVWFLFLSMGKSWDLKHVIVYRCSVLFIQPTSGRQLKYSCHSPQSDTLTNQSETHKHLPDFAQRNWELWSHLTLVSCITFQLSKLEDSCLWRGEKKWVFSNAFCSFFFPMSASSFLIKIQQQIWRAQITGVRHEAARVSFHCCSVLACISAFYMALPGCTHCPAAACLPPIQPPPGTFC